MDKKAITLTNGIIIRIVASLIDVLSLPFLILNPSNPIAQIAFGFGNFLLIIGGLID